MDPARNFFKQQMMSDCVEGNYDTLPIIRAFPNGSRLFVLVIRLRVDLLRFFGR